MTLNSILERILIILGFQRVSSDSITVYYPKISRILMEPLSSATNFFKLISRKTGYHKKMYESPLLHAIHTLLYNAAILLDRIATYSFADEEKIHKSIQERTPSPALTFRSNPFRVPTPPHPRGGRAEGANLPARPNHR